MGHPINIEEQVQFLVGTLKGKIVIDAQKIHLCFKNRIFTLLTARIFFAIFYSYNVLSRFTGIEHLRTYRGP